ncbi:alginate O-acetyltransferase AlgX-related protein [Actinopolyspora xinjiangensis]|uniref:alginate O-acetyltransferase AlgX-related protein n=1 Tax=Actinopolyspora xinjiangensis TaxID=405564 RepID=UPI001FCDD16F|nr:hypothetical protein [Actinopolyspora xinjiangensis]
MSGKQSSAPRAADRDDRPDGPTELPPVHEAWLPREHPLHRPRHGAKQYVALVCAFLFFAAPVLAWTLGARAKPLENRPLASFPSITEGWGFFTGLNDWAGDRLAFRPQAVHAVEGISEGVFGEPAPHGSEPGGAPVGGGGGDGERPPSTPDPALFPDVIRGEDGWLFLGHDMSYKCLPDMELDRIITGLRRWRSVVEASGREFRLVIAPDKSTVYSEHMPDEYVGRDCMRRLRSEFWQRVPEATGAIDMRPTLRELDRRRDEPVFTKVDTHWRHVGGLAMVRRLAESLEPGVTDTWKVEPGRTYQHRADIPALIGKDRKWTVRSYSLAPDGGADNTRFLGSDFHEPLRLESRARPGMIDEPTRMIADSFTQFASPYLAASFSDITIAHPNNVLSDPEEAGRMLAEGEVVTFEFSERFLAGGRYAMLAPDMAERVGRILKRNPV